MTPMKLLGHAQFHGANRLADKTSRWFWAPALLILLGPAITLVLLTVKRYQENPTYMVKIDSAFRIKRFPAVVLCPEIQFVEEKMDAFVAELKYPPGMNSTKMREILPQLAALYSLDMSYTLQELLRVEQVLEYNGLSLETAGEILTATCEETVLRCRWNHFMVNCSTLFRMEMTGDGFCCVFNGRSLKREMQKYGKNIQVTQPHQHHYTKSFGYTSGLMIAVNQSQTPTIIDISYKWVATLTSQHFVDMSMNGTALNPGSEHWIAFYTRGYQIAMGARSLRKSLRKCNMSTDKLRYFPAYSRIFLRLPRFCSASEMLAESYTDGFQAIIHKKTAFLLYRVRSSRIYILRLVAESYTPNMNHLCGGYQGLKSAITIIRYCTLEEEMANTLDKCKCVRVNHPKPPGARVCSAAMLQCASQALIAYDSTSTSCPMTCDVEKTSFIASSFKLDDSVRTADPFYKGLNFKKVSVLRVFIQSRKRPTLERWSYYDYLDLFSQIGGMFSVFFGCSILTLLGLLHFVWRVLVKRCQKK